MSVMEHPAESPMHLGVTIYVWGDAHQNRLLVECLQPAARELRERGRCAWFWYERFDARGPHIFAIFTVRRDAGDDVARDLGRRIAAYLTAQPSTDVLSPEVLATRHAECRDKRQCAVDGEPGMAANNTYRMFEHPSGGVPFVLAEGMAAARAQALWGLVDDLASWAIAQIAPPALQVPVTTAARWLAALDGALRAAGLEPEGYWRYHASTLLVGLEQGLAASEADVLRSLPSSIGEKNRQALSRVWQYAEATGPIWAPLHALVDLVASEPGWPIEDRRRLLRKLVHTALKQLGLPVAQHIPMVLFAWHRSLAGSS
jgi:hypothetical protein